MALRANACRLLQHIFVIAGAAVLSSPAWALSPDLSLRQFHHTGWTTDDGAPTGIEALAQTADGYLWIAGAAGLFRFDGARFERIDAVGGQRLLSNDILTLFAPRTGGLWIGYRFGGASFMQGGRVANYDEDEGLPPRTLTGFVQDRSGTMWATTSGSLCRFDGSTWQDVGEALRLPSEYIKVMHVTRDATLWIVNGRDVMFLRSGQSAFQSAGIRTGEADLDFVEAPDGTLWLTDVQLGAHAVYVPDETTRVRRDWTPLRDAGGVPIWGKLVDRHGALWLASATGLHRLKNAARMLDPGFAADATLDVFTNVDGLTSPFAWAFLEDREGNVWIGTTRGLDRFRESRLTPVHLPRSSNGFALAAAEGGTMLVGLDLDDGLFEVTAPSGVKPVRGLRRVYAAHREESGVLWLGGGGSLWRSSGSPGAEWVPMSLPVDPAHANYYPVQAVAKDGSGTLWVSLVRGGLMRQAGEKWTRIGDPALSLGTDAEGRVWAGYLKSRIEIFDAGADRGRELSTRDGLDVGNVTSMHAGAGATWVGGEHGLARFDGTRFHPVMRLGGQPFQSVSGIVATPAGDLWLNTSAGAIRIAADEVQRLSRDPRHAVRHELFDFLDGMPGTPTSIRPLPTLAAGTDGRLWFATTSGVVWIDPTRIRRNRLAPQVEVQYVSADGARYEPGTDPVLPIGTRNLQIGYTALSLAIPERVRFRYQLGAGEPWQDAGSRRTAYFTRLDPGGYTFRVIASNEDGVWNETGASIRFSIPPAFYQTRWFYALCALVGLAILAAAYRVRMHQVAAQVRGRLEARLGERERIARELHDTLLQGVQGLIWRFQAATNRIPAGEPARELMEQSLERADRLLEESRDKVKDLRPASGSIADLVQALAAEGEQSAQLDGAQFRVSVEGTTRDLHPIVREEGFLIAREALSNAFQHAHAGSIEAEISYGAVALHVRIRDDGLGISPDVLDGGKPGHFGMLGMRERAKKLGAHLDVWSKPGAGTEVELRVPADVAYRRSAGEPRGLRAWLGKLSSSVHEH